MKLNNKELIQSYVFTTAKYDFNVYEKRILYKIVEHLQQFIKGKKLNEKYSISSTSKGHRELTIDIKDFLTAEDKNHSRIKEALFSLNEKWFEYEDEGNWAIIRIIEMPELEGDNTDESFFESKVNFIINRKLFDVFLNFSKGYRKYELELAMSFKSNYSMRFYELFSGKTTPIVYSIENLKEILKISDKYKNNADFFKRIIDPVQAELVRFSPYAFQYEKMKTGRTYTHIKFKPFFIPKNRSEELEKKELQKKESIHWSLSKEQLEYLKSNFEFTDDGIKNNRDIILAFTQIEGAQDHILNINKMIREYEIGNKAGFFIKQIQKILNQDETTDSNSKNTKSFKSSSLLSDFANKKTV